MADSDLTRDAAAQPEGDEMRIAVTGASGRTGRLVTELALAHGHEVAALVRDPSRLAIAHPRLDVIACDALDVGALTSAFEGADAVLSTIGSSSSREAPTQGGTHSATMRVMIDAMLATGVHRIVAVSAGRVGLEPAEDRDRALAEFGPVLGPVLHDMRLMERMLADSGLEWTVIRPGRLTEGSAGATVATVDAPTRPGTETRRADLADAMLRAAEEGAWCGHAVALESLSADS